MLSSVVAILLSAFTLTAFGAVERAELAVVVQPAVAAKATEMMKASLVRAPALATANSAKAPPAQSAPAAATDDKPPEVSLEMVLAALALMIVITMRRFRSGPR